MFTDLELDFASLYLRALALTVGGTFYNDEDQYPTTMNKDQNRAVCYHGKLGWIGWECGGPVHLLERSEIMSFLLKGLDKDKPRLTLVYSN